ncbi:insulinase family protein [Shewanella zhangzhouensis]|uniref:insulinase family protein n=1 Tax=Shewanella zhangzhouensis TaxID=2864213 RepID=UPI001C65F1C6|nr:insulinase family protein [Shewanella zhangzhouensis]QYK03837.1 insulinase family protein [Shewanella zhangzhouensis]
MPVNQFPLTSPNDHRQYQYLVLDNALRVLLVSDPQASQAAASMAVNVGHFDDPAQRLGMAHFLEHMLFLGTEKYPDPAEYHAFINQHGGSNNAWTGTEHTNFFFTINADVFDESLDRFSQFFIAPAFNRELVDRERQAIESEYSLKLKDDVRRMYQVHKETVNPAHPFSKFSVGNLDTLGGDQDELREELLQFYQTHYSANLMTLCLVSPEPLTALDSMARQYFGAIKNTGLKKRYPEVPLYTDNELGTWVQAIPLKEQKRLTLTFPLPGIDRFYRHKPLTFLSHLLGNESEGSLQALLKEKGWVNQLSAGGGVNGYNFKDYNISFQLTDRGLGKLDDIIRLTFEYLEMIKSEGLEEWRYRERASLLKLAFRYQEQIKAIDLASHLSINMHHYGVEDLIFGDYRMDGLDIAECESLLSQMSLDNMRVQLVCQEVDTNRQANWYHTPYASRPLEEQELSRWRPKGDTNGLRLPEPNPFIVEDAQARPDKSLSPVPTVVAEATGYRLWHKKDDEFNVPKGHLFLSLDSEQASQDPRNAALTRLYVEMLLDYLTEYTYPAEVAGLNYNIYPHQGGLTLHLSGFTGNQETLLALLISKARERNFTQERFNVIKRQLLRSWYNAAQAKPISQLFTSLTVTLQRRSYEPLRMAEMLEECTLEDLHEHVRAFYEKIYLEGLVYGDWLTQEAKALGHRLSHILSLVSTPSGESARELVNLTGKGTMLRELTISHQDSAIIVYYQSPSATPEKMALFALMNHTMSSTFFHELRTEQQLGYMVGTGYLPLNRHPGMIFYIQSPSAGPLQLLEAIDEFIADFSYAVMQITKEQWESTKTGLINQVMEHDANLKTRGQRYWASIGNKDYGFNQRELVVAEIEKLTRADLIKFMMQRMRTKHCDRLVLFSTGEQHRHLQALSSDKMITDLRTFKLHSDKFHL